ncbi:uncharacterized protein N7483_000689 [Penicillium malachiteum]|uniref:uncharacterized protein n=1 Tax=Penicillium malachiteum TaxID=1324776 RepID=UPI002548E0F5|nr:uncharacterized protein N7483_000689 [Penicillium malachiteum]KAJ5735564.1 hypothetical protein N7483_000689 [Penicillium malachiteum]
MSPLPTGVVPLISPPSAGSLVTSNTTTEQGPNNTTMSSTRTETKPLEVDAWKKTMKERKGKTANDLNCKASQLLEAVP